jgi:hypothetical protein
VRAWCRCRAAPVDVAVDLGQFREGVGETLVSCRSASTLRARETLALVIGGSPPLDCKHLEHVGHCIAAKEQRVQERERHGDQAEPERHHGHDGEGDEKERA